MIVPARGGAKVTGPVFVGIATLRLLLNLATILFFLHFAGRTWRSVAALAFVVTFVLPIFEAIVLNPALRLAGFWRNTESDGDEKGAS